MYWSYCDGWPAHRALVQFLHASRLLLMCDVESALSLLTEIASLLGYACGVRACFVVSCRVFSRLDDEVGGLIARVGPCRCVRGWYVVLPVGASCAQALSCRAEFSRPLDDEMESLIAHVGPCW